MNSGQRRTLLLVLLVLASAAVILGALGKAQGWKGADVLVMAGLVTELLAGIGFVVLSLRKRR